MSAATLAASAAIIKELYQDGEVPEELYVNNNGFLWLPKRTDFKGRPERVAIKTEHTQGASANFATAQSNIRPSTYNAFLVNRVKDYSIASIDGEALQCADGGESSLVDLWDEEMKSAMHAAVRSIAIMMYRSGTGSRGQLDGLSNVATNQVTLSNPSEATNFALGMALQGSATDGSALLSAGAQEIIAGLDRVNGVLTSTSAAWNTTVAFTNTSFLYRAGDCINGGAVGTEGVGVIVGMKGWIPGGPSPSALFGVTRANDPTRLAGQLYTATGTPIEEAVFEAIARCAVQGGRPDTLICHPRDMANLQKSLFSKSTFPQTTTRIGSATVGFDAVVFASDSGPISLISDMNCPRYTAFLVEKSSWFLGSIGKAPQILDFDDSTFLRESTSDTYTVRVGSYLQLVCNAPVKNLQIANFGT